jgi:hypothetical protein
MYFDRRLWELTSIALAVLVGLALRAGSGPFSAILRQQPRKRFPQPLASRLADAIGLAFGLRARDEIGKPKREAEKEIAEPVNELYPPPRTSP